MHRCIAGAAALVLASCGRLHFEPVGGGGGANGDGGFTFGDGKVPPANGSGGTVSGTRLRAMELHGDEGSIAPDFRFGLYDTQMTAPCAFEPAADGSTRCLPHNLEVSPTTYADSTCTQPAAVLSDVSRGCYTQYAHDAGNHIYTLGAMLSVIYTKSGTSCFPAGVFTPWYALGAEIPPSMFVAGAMVTVASGRLSYRQWAGEDGSLLFTGSLLDTMTGNDCAIEPDVGQADPVCATEHVYHAVFTDSACTNAVFGPVDGAPTDIFALDNATYAFSQPCSLRTYHQPGVAVTPGQTYDFGAGGCEIVGATTATFVSDAGTIPRSTFASGAFEAASTDRIYSKRWHGADGMVVPLPGDGLFDATLAARCSPAADSAAALRCIPGPDLATDLFVDSSCSAITGFFASCAGRATFENTIVSASSCAGTLGQQVQTPTPATTAFGFDPHGACVEVLGGAVTAGTDPTSSGTILAPAGFVALTPVVQ